MFSIPLAQGYYPYHGKDMSKVTSKRQVSIPKEVADRYGIAPGDEIDWIPAGDEIRVVPSGHRASTLSPAERLRLFDRASERRDQRRAGGAERPPVSETDRGWTRDDLYPRGRTG